MWTHQDSIVIKAPASTIWALFSNVGRWKDWNAGIETIELYGPFHAGSRFTMTPPGQDALVSTLVDVRPDEGFVDETVVGPNRVVVKHEIHALADGSSRVDYATEITGPEAEEIGGMVTGDFPEVLAALKRLAEGGGGG